MPSRSRSLFALWRIEELMRFEMINRFSAAVSAAALLVLAGCGSGSPTGDGAAGYPNRTITLICPWAAGGGTDRMARFMADQLQRQLGKPVVVVNRTGGSGAAGHSAGALAKPDGYTLTMATFELSWENFDPVIQLNADAAAIVVRADAPWKSLPELLEFVRQNPGKLKMSGTAAGGAWDLARAGFLLAAGLPVDSVLWVPTQGAAPSLVELLGGHIEAVCCSVPEAATQIEAGQIRPLAVMSPERLAQFPDIPTVKEGGVEWEAVGWRGLVAPKGTPPEIIQMLNSHCMAILAQPPFLAFMKQNGFAVAVRQPEEFARFLQAQDEQWKSVIQSAGYARK
jgi:tripartite-type tricarboxylate transporter receptor subunit TctC